MAKKDADFFRILFNSLRIILRFFVKLQSFPIRAQSVFAHHGYNFASVFESGSWDFRRIDFLSVNFDAGNSFANVRRIFHFD